MNKGATLINLKHCRLNGLRTPREEIAFTARPKIQSQSQTFRYSQSIFCLPYWTIFSDIFDLCLHWVSVVRGSTSLIGICSENQILQEFQSNSCSQKKPASSIVHITLKRNHPLLSRYAGFEPRSEKMQIRQA